MKDNTRFGFILCLFILYPLTLSFIALCLCVEVGELACCNLGSCSMLTSSRTLLQVFSDVAFLVGLLGLGLSLCNSAEFCMNLLVFKSYFINDS